MPRRVAQWVLALGGRPQPVGVDGLDVELRAEFGGRVVAQAQLRRRERRHARRRDRLLDVDLARIGGRLLRPARVQLGQPGLDLAAPGRALADNTLDEFPAPLLAARPVAGKLGVRLGDLGGALAPRSRGARP